MRREVESFNVKQAELEQRKRNVFPELWEYAPACLEFIEGWGRPTIRISSCHTENKLRLDSMHLLFLLCPPKPDPARATVLGGIKGQRSRFEKIADVRRVIKIGVNKKMSQ